MSVTSSGRDGRFALPRRERAGTVIVVADGGYALAAARGVKESLRLKLTPWGKIEGSLTIGDRPATAGARIAADYQAPSADGLTVFFTFSASTDEQGRFAFNRAFAGEYKVFRRTDSGNGRVVSASVKQGEATAVALVASGRPVAGRLALPDGLCDREDLVVLYERLEPPRRLARVTLPTNALRMTPGERFAWFRGWSSSPWGEQLAADRAAHKGLPLVNQGPVNGEAPGFKAAELPAGTYHLSVRIHTEVQAGEVLGNANRVASLAYRFTVPPIPGGASDEVLDVGMLRAHPYGTLDAGQPAPDFVYTTADGNARLLSELRGKVVLLGFWGTWCGPCVAAMPVLRDIQAKFGARPDFRLIGLNVDDEPATVREFARVRQVTWSQGVLGPRDGEQAWPAALYCVSSIPVYVLIGRDGEVQYYGQSHHGLAKVVSAALESSTPVTPARSEGPAGETPCL